LPAPASGQVKSSLNVTVKVYMNGTYLDIFDTFDTNNLRSLAMAIPFEPRLHRLVRIWTTHGDLSGAFSFINVERQRSGWYIGPFFIPHPFQREIGPLDPIPAGEKGRGHVYGRTWFARGQGLPSALVMHLAITELAGEGISATLGESMALGPMGSYTLRIEHIYADMRF